MVAEPKGGLAVDSPALSEWRRHMLSAAQLETLEFPPLASYIDGLVIEGLTVFGGKPKLGKSWWAMRAGLTIATGGVAFGNPGRAVTQARVLYLALEDGLARLQTRLGVLLSPDERWPAGMTVVPNWPRFDEGGLDLLSEAVDVDGFQVVIVDTLARVRKRKRRGLDPYQEDSDAMSMIHDLTRARPGLAIVVVHHHRKNDNPDDYVDALSGTTGITGVPDHIAVLQRGRGEADAVLRFTSRDAAEHDTAYSFTGGLWSEIGPAVLAGLSEARRELYDLLVSLDRPTPAAALAQHLGKSQQTVAELLGGLAADGLARQVSARGPWEVPSIPSIPESGVSGDSGDSGNTGETGTLPLPDPAEPPPEPEDITW